MVFAPVASVAHAQTVEVASFDISLPAPAADAPFQERQDWCDAYVHWMYGSSPDQAPAAARENHQIEVDLNQCKLNPVQFYEQTAPEREYRLQG